MIGACPGFASFVFFIVMIFDARVYGQRITVYTCWDDHADTLGWTLPCPPPEHTFEQFPRQSDWDKGRAHQTELRLTRFTRSNTLRNSHRLVLSWISVNLNKIEGNPLQHANTAPVKGALRVRAG